MQPMNCHWCGAWPIVGYVGRQPVCHRCLARSLGQQALIVGVGVIVCVLWWFGLPTTKAPASSMPRPTSTVIQKAGGSR